MSMSLDAEGLSELLEPSHPNQRLQKKDFVILANTVIKTVPCMEYMHIIIYINKFIYSNIVILCFAD